MLDWKRMVREKLGHLPLDNGRQEEVIEELAHQLEAAYEEAVANGVSAQEAERKSLEQFGDWAKLRSEVFRSIEGTKLPVWEQDGIFSPRRLPVWVALALTLVLVAVPAFRQALAILPVPGGNPTAWSSSLFSEGALRGIEQSGDKQRYARTLAFVALHSPDDLQARHAAEKAVALDPQLTWISAQVSHATDLRPRYDPHPWIERPKAWDPQNAFPYLLEASASIKYNADARELRRVLAAEPAWRVPMEQAFSAPRLDFYGAQQFRLDRQVLEEQGLDRPDMLMFAVWSRPMPNFIAIRIYEDFQLEDGESAEKAGRTQEALAAYWNVAGFGERLQEGSSDIAEMFSVKLREDAYKRMIPLLRREGRTDEATAVEAALRATSAANPNKREEIRDILREASAARSARMVSVSAFFVVILEVTSAVWLMFVVTLRWKPNLDRALNRLASVLCYAPPLLWLACLTLFLCYYPYARSIGQFGSAKAFAYSYGPFLENLYVFMNIESYEDIWLPMFWPSVWCAVVALAGVLLLRWVARCERPDRTGVA